MINSCAARCLHFPNSTLRASSCWSKGIERIVLPRLAEADGFLVDPSFVAIAPLGGRHVQHFWRLLKGASKFRSQLLLDLGSWPRRRSVMAGIKTAMGHCDRTRRSREKSLLGHERWGGSVSEEEFPKQCTAGQSTSTPLGWIDALKGYPYGVFFSASA